MVFYRGTVWSVVSSVGTRYKLSPLRDLMIDLRFQYFNWVDGLNPNPAIYKENKANDWLVWLNVVIFTTCNRSTNFI
jgi:hypothetical protein